MAARKRSSSAAFANKVAPFAPLAIALAVGAGLSGGHPASMESTPASPHTHTQMAAPSSISGLAPLLQKGHPVDWWFVFKFNAKVFPGCGEGVQRACPFGGQPQPFPHFSQQFAYASSDSATLQQGSGCAGGSTGDAAPDPIGATFNEVYNGSFHFVVWNDQFYDAPKIAGCTKECGAPWGHSKGLVAWDDSGQGLVMQVSTPDWPGAGSASTPRQDEANTLGCTTKDNDVQVSQHFFALRLSKDDLVQVLKGLQNASVVTDPKDPQIVKNGGPADVQQLVNSLGVRSSSTTVLTSQLSTGVELISKPSNMKVPPWQMVSSILGGIPLRTATWWATPPIPSTTSSTVPGCWDSSLVKPPGPVDIATTGTWSGQVFGLKGGPGPDFNHAKLGVSTSTSDHYAIFGDMNQQGSLNGPNCGSSQNGRGGTFYAVPDPELTTSLTSLIAGDSAPAK
jgi:hypothetical protein